MPATSGRFTDLEHPPVRVFTLGRFQVEVDRAPLRFGRKTQRRPLDLLKLLIAYGGEGIFPEQIAEDLWPDSEGDAALAALRSTLSRLRKLIGADAVLGDARGLALNEKRCWVDALALHRLLTQAVGGMRAALEEALSLYRGEFLPGVGHLPAVLSARAKLHRLILRHVVELGGQFEQSGQPEQAMDLYRRGLEIDGGAQDIARKLERLCAAFAGTTPAELSIAVLPFEDLSTGGGYQRLADAIRETVFSLLGVLPQLRLISRANQEQSISPVRYLLRGSVLVSGDRLRASVQLLDARSGEHAWSEHQDHGLQDAIRTQDEVAIRAAEAIAAKLILGDVGRLLLSPNVRLWKAIGQVRVLFDRQTRQDHQRARALIGRMLELEPGEPLVQGLVATTAIIESWKCWTAHPAAGLRASELRLRKLRKRYGVDAQGLQALPWACALRGEIDEAIRFARGNVERMPENFFSHAYLGVSLAYQGRYAQALEALNGVFQVRPQPAQWLYKDRASIEFCMGRYEDAAIGLERMLVDEYPLHRDADLLSARLLHVGCLVGVGQAERAHHEAAAVRATHPSVSSRRWSRWHFQPYRDSGQALRIERLLVAAGLPP